MVRLTPDEEKLLADKYPQLNYNRERSVISGSFSINHSYHGITIKDAYQIDVKLSSMTNRKQFPKVYNSDGRINRIARRKKINPIDLHVYDDNMLCLGLPERFSEYYPNEFDLSMFLMHLSEHFYWVSYYERYDKAPWSAELHGEDAVVDYYIEKADIPMLRFLHKKITGVGISKQKLRNYLKSNELVLLLKERMHKNE